MLLLHDTCDHLFVECAKIAQGNSFFSSLNTCFVFSSDGTLSYSPLLGSQVPRTK